jgi:hypothetical protein
MRVDPVSTIIDAFASYPVVALGEGPHGNVQGHVFRLALLRDPRFNRRRQRHRGRKRKRAISGLHGPLGPGEAVPEAELLRAVRENTVTPTPAWDRPMYEEMFRAVRDLNRSLPAERRLRILLGDPPIDWREVKTADEYRGWLMQRDSHPAALIQREVLAKGRRALVVYGDGHFQARSERPGPIARRHLETSGARVFTVTSTFADLSPFQKDVAGWRTPWLASLKGTLLGAAPYATFFGPPPPVDFFKANPLIEDHFDAVLVMGTASEMRLAPLEYPHCNHPDYARMRRVRMELAAFQWHRTQRRLSRECAAAAPK